MPQLRFSADFHGLEVGPERSFRWSLATSALLLNSVDELRLGISSCFPHLTSKEQAVYVHVDDDLFARVDLTRHALGPVGGLTPTAPDHRLT